MLCSPPRGRLIAAPPGDVNVGEHDETSLCTGSPWTPRLGIQLGGVDLDPPCATPLRRGSSGVGSEEPRTLGFRVPTGGGLNQHPLWFLMKGRVSTLTQRQVPPILVTKMADEELSLAPKVHQSDHWILPIKDSEKVENNTCPILLHSLYLMKLFSASYPEGNFGRQTQTQTQTQRHRYRHRHRDKNEDNKTRSETMNKDYTHVGLCGSCFKTVRTRPCTFSETTWECSENFT